MWTQEVYYVPNVFAKFLPKRIHVIVPMQAQIVPYATAQDLW